MYSFPLIIIFNVVPRAGTWIETLGDIYRGADSDASFPVRERGLKPHTAHNCISMPLSFPVRERGLKLTTINSFLFPFDVVPRAGTRIETICTNNHHFALL